MATVIFSWIRFNMLTWEIAKGGNKLLSLQRDVELFWDKKGKWHFNLHRVDVSAFDAFSKFQHTKKGCGGNML